ncbi:hypothetical protein P9B03_04015 [Metasolibacillus meyeri]|uniref:Uncharacterized protein n=1 Tax=Metasolibacillus meyeri TaxID=1071052 RepID=A0AAW9NT55_9BACL|nr:hypothetical protein [Metasolibacillus meyeri]MEC1177640.1 hypothetical protein [Metasolibacillus meyeri]
MTNETSDHLYLCSEDIEDVQIVWDEWGYKQISVILKNGKMYTVESDS